MICFVCGCRPSWRIQRKFQQFPKCWMLHLEQWGLLPLTSQELGACSRNFMKLLTADQELTPTKRWPFDFLDPMANRQSLPFAVPVSDCSASTTPKKQKKHIWAQQRFHQRFRLLDDRDSTGQRLAELVNIGQLSKSLGGTLFGSLLIDPHIASSKDMGVLMRPKADHQERILRDDQNFFPR